MRASNVCEKGTELRLTRGALTRMRRKALRQRCWFKALDRLERGIVDLTIRCVEEVKSIKLQTTLRNILAKLAETFGPSYLDKVERVGRSIAVRISWLAQSWGSTRAEEWKDDTAFIMYLGANALSPEMSRL